MSIYTSAVVFMFVHACAPPAAADGEFDCETVRMEFDSRAQCMLAMNKLKDELPDGKVVTGVVCRPPLEDDNP